MGNQATLKRTLII